MSNQLSPQVVSQMMAQESGDPFLTLVTLSHPDWADEVRLANNTENITSRGESYIAYPMKIRFPVDDGETMRDFQIELDNVSLDLMTGFRSATTPIDVKIEMILASMPDEVQISQEELKIQSITYNKQRITARIILDNFLNTEMSSERYNPTNFPGLFG